MGRWTLSYRLWTFQASGSDPGPLGHSNQDPVTTLNPRNIPANSRHFTFVPSLSVRVQSVGVIEKGSQTYSSPGKFLTHNPLRKKFSPDNSHPYISQLGQCPLGQFPPTLNLMPTFSISGFVKWELLGGGGFSLLGMVWMRTVRGVVRTRLKHEWVPNSLLLLQIPSFPAIFLHRRIFSCL